MRPTPARLLLLAGLLALAVTYALMQAFYLRLPDALPRTAPLSVLVAGLLELLVTFSVRARLAGRPGTRPILPLTVARLAALARASSLVGAVVLGIWAGVLANTLPRGSQPPVAGADSITAGLGLGASIVLLVGGLLLESACRIRRS
jgi:Protein of unknown function (DUF3180)